MTRVLISLGKAPQQDWDESQHNMGQATLLVLKCGNDTQDMEIGFLPVEASRLAEAKRKTKIGGKCSGSERARRCFLEFQLFPVSLLEVGGRRERASHLQAQTLRGKYLLVRPLWNWPRKMYSSNLEINSSLTQLPAQKQPG